MADQTVLIPGDMLIVQRRSAPFDDTVTISDARVHNTPRPLPVKPSPAYAPGELGGHNWGGYFMESLNGLRTGLYAPVPIKVLNPDGTLSVVQLRYQYGPEIEQAAIRLAGSWEWPGKRYDNMISPYSTFRDTPRAVASDPTLWTGISLSGFFYHLEATGEVTGIAGPWLDPGVMPLAGGGGKTWHGDFTDHDGVVRRWGVTNDFDFHPTLRGSAYVCDIANSRIALAVHLGGTDMEIKTFAAGLTRPTSCQVDKLDGSLWVTESRAGRVTRIVPNGEVEGTRQVMISGLNDPFCIRQFSDGNFAVVENGGLQRLMEFDRQGNFVREIRQLRTPEGSFGLNWLWFDVDVNGVWGTKDALQYCISGSLQAVAWVNRDGTGHSYLVRQGKLPHGPFSDTMDPAGHYPWVVAIGRRHAHGIWMGFGSTGATQVRRRQPGDSTRAQFNLDFYNQGLTAQYGGGTGPSFWPISGSAGFHFLGGPTTEELDAMTQAEFSAWVRKGGLGNTPRPEFSDNQCRAFKYLIKTVSLRGLSDLTVDPAGGTPPPPPPAPTIDLFTATPETVVAGTSTSLSWITSNATVVTLNGVAVLADDTQEFVPVGTTTYTLTADGVSRTITVTVLPPPKVAKVRVTVFDDFSTVVENL